MSVMSRRGFAASLVAAATLPGCSSGPRYHFNFRTVVSVTLGGSRFVGEGVQGYTAYNSTSFPNPGSMVHSRLRGDSVPVKLPNDRVLFALLVEAGDMGAVGYLDDWAITKILGPHYGVDAGWQDNESEGTAFLESVDQGEVVESPRDKFPLFATFENLSDPASIRLVDADTLHGLGLGPGRIESVTLQITPDKITRESTRLLHGMRKKSGPGSGSYGTPFQFYPSHFTAY